MTLIALDDPLADASDRALSYTDNVIPQLAAWSRMGERCALVTLAGIDGTAPRSLGAQMAIRESGQWTGYISGGCLEKAIALEAVEAIKAQKHRMIRYGKDSPYIDIRLPCGSGLDVFVQPLLDNSLIGDMERRAARREPFALAIDLASGGATVRAIESGSRGEMLSRREGDLLLRVYAPAIRCLIIGASPIAASLAQLSASAGFDTVFHAPDFESMPALPPSIGLRPYAPPYTLATDAWTAAILAFHDHEQEMPALKQLLDSPCFFVTAIGSRKAHNMRVLALQEAGFDEDAIARVRSPAGLISGLKAAPYVALSILAQMIAVARERQLLA